MSARLHLLTGEFPPSSGGIARFTAATANELARLGVEVHVWAPLLDRDRQPQPFQLHALPDDFGSASRAILASAIGGDDVLLLQYAPNALGARGLNVPFCRWMLAQSRLGRDVRVMFHEPFFYFGWQSPRRNGLAAVHRVMATLLLRASRLAYLSTPAWEPLLRPYAPAGFRFSWVPIPSAVPVVTDAAAVDRLRRSLAAPFVVGHFSSYPDDVRAALRSTLSAVLDRHATCAVFCIGRGSREFAGTLSPGPRVHASGELALRELSIAIQACDVFVQPYPDGVTARRTTMTTLLAHEAAVVTTSGALTESFWTAHGDVAALAPAGKHAELAREALALSARPARRRELKAAAGEFYARHFDVTHAATAFMRPSAEAATLS